MFKFIKKLFKKNKKKQGIGLSLQPVKNVAETADCLDLKDQPKKKAGRPKSAAPAKKPAAKKTSATSTKPKKAN